MLALFDSDGITISVAKIRNMIKNEITLFFMYKYANTFL